MTASLTGSRDNQPSDIGTLGVSHLLGSKSQRPLVSMRGHWGRGTGGYNLAAFALVGAGFRNRKAIHFIKAKVFGGAIQTLREA